jgi:hypothetical protein
MQLHTCKLGHLTQPTQERPESSLFMFCTDLAELFFNGSPSPKKLKQAGLSRAKLEISSQL